MTTSRFGQALVLTATANTTLAHKARLVVSEGQEVRLSLPSDFPPGDVDIIVVSAADETSATPILAKTEVSSTHHLIVLGERHLLHLVRQYVRYYNEDRLDMWMDGDAPVSRAVEPPSNGPMVALHRVRGFQHRYTRAA